MEYFSITNTRIDLPFILANNFKSRKILFYFDWIKNYFLVNLF